MAEIGKEEREAVLRALDSGNLSGFIAGKSDGGPEVKALEEEWAAHFGYKYATAMNSATSGLIACCKAIKQNSWKSFIVSPLTMSASAIGPFAVNNPIRFIDIEAELFCLDAQRLKKEINGCNAVIVTDLFGQAYDPEITNIAHSAGVYVIEDASQRPMPGQGDLVVYSLNYHKHIHCGEGGIVCTNNINLARKLRLLRNHAENANVDYFGFNFRLTEIQAAIAREQLKKLPGVLKDRQERAKELKGLAPTRKGFEHAWYLYPYLSDPPDNAFKYDSFLPNLKLFQDTLGEYPVAKEVSKKLRVARP